MSLDHPFDKSCVEADLVTKVFGGIWNLESSRSRRIWAALLSSVDVGVETLRWSDARVQFSPYPRHHGGEAGKEIGDVVLLSSDLNVVLEAKRPGFAGDPPHERAKISRATDLAKAKGWPAPTFVCVVSHGCCIAENRPLTWERIAEIYRAEPDELSQAIAAFIEVQLRLQPASNGSHSEFGSSRGTSDTVFTTEANHKLAQCIHRRYEHRYGLALNCREASGYANLYGKGAVAQLHETVPGRALAIAIPDVGDDATFPVPKALLPVALASLTGYAQPTCKRWLDGTGKFTSKPARAFLLCEDLRFSDSHAVWQEVDDMIYWANDR